MEAKIVGENLTPANVIITNEPDIWSAPTVKRRDTLGNLIRANKELPNKIYMTMVDLLEHKDAKIKVIAATFLADRGWGKPVQQVIQENRDDSTIDWQTRKDKLLESLKQEIETEKNIALKVVKND